MASASELIGEIVRLMKAGGYFNNIMAAGPELDRVKQHLLNFENYTQYEKHSEYQYPAYPIFPGLEHQSFYDTSLIEDAQILEKNFDIILKEAKAIQSGYISYSPRPTGILKNLGRMFNSKKVIKTWSLYPFYYTGVDLESDNQQCPETLKILKSLPNLCVDYPWGDALFSLHQTNTHLPAHCSVDNLRIRCHLGLIIPDNSEIRVGNEKRNWEEGKCLVFDDSFEHEVWNRSDKDRLIMIVDFWNPGFTAIEREALAAGFRKSEIRKILYRDRLVNTDAPKSLYKKLEKQFELEDQEPIISKYWN